MKNVLLLGDSIRMLYQPKVKELLKGRANVYGPAENGRWSDYTLNSLRFWLPQLPDADIVHWSTHSSRTALAKVHHLASAA